MSPVSTLWLTAWLANCHLTFPGSLPLQWTWLCLLTLSLFVCFSFKWYLRNNITFRTMYCSFMWLPCFSWLLITEFYIFYSWKLEILWNCFPLKIPSWPLEQCTATSSSRVCLTSRQTWYLTIQKLLFAVFHFFISKTKSKDITSPWLLFYFQGLYNVFWLI